MQPRNPAASASLLSKDAPAEGGSGSGSGKRANGGKASATSDMQGVLAGDELTPDFCIIGAGSGGLALAAAAAAFGQKVVLIEKHKMGGDCLNYGCVPSKALIAAARRAHVMRTASPFGISAVEPTINATAVHDHVKSVIAAIAPNDSVERFTGLGVRVILGAARFLDKKTVSVGEHRIKARRFVIATGSAPAVPAIPGLNSVPYFTNETIFDSQQKLDHLVIIGGGPIGLELAQAYLRLGSRVTVIEAAAALGKDDPEMTPFVLERLKAEGVDIRERTKIELVEGQRGHVRVHVSTPVGGPAMVDGTHILVATGRTANVKDLGLEEAGIKVGAHGIEVNGSLKTSNPIVYAIGDVTGGLQYTHVAEYHASVVLKNALFWLPAKADAGIVPWVTFTDPELAQAGLSEAEALRQGHKIKVLRWPYHENDRAQAERATDGHIKVVTDKNGRILGATIVGEHAGELIQMWSLAISQKLKINAMRDWISPYPTLSEINKRAAYRYYATVPASPLVRKVIGFLAKFG